MSKLASAFKQYGYLLGFLGFLGFLYFKYDDPNSLIFFVFFGFFGFKWSAKYMDVEKDELFKANSYKAAATASGISLSIIYITAILLETYLFPFLFSDLFSFLSIENKYFILHGTILISFSLTLILYGYLLDKYEKSSRKKGAVKN